MTNVCDQSVLWTRGTDGYFTYRIPVLVVTNSGTVIAICEGRKSGSGDSGDIDTLVKRSEDGGRSWSDQHVIWDQPGNVCGNPCAVVDHETGHILLLMTHNLGVDRESQIIDQTS
ncbi:MAG: exo-alpha-sialidase, partial [Candidatus Latescibacteria bacterium]|nr:exo-alpha-sialidase [Candidatus Latescibacterota bacterium]